MAKVIRYIKDKIISSLFMYNIVFPYCSSCKAKKNLCGLGYCPIIKNLKSSGLELKMVSGDAEADTPPGIFVGSYGYPEVLAGPTALFNPDVFDYGKERFGMKLEEVISMNSNVYRTASKMSIRRPDEKFHEYILESASSIKPFEIAFKTEHFSMHGPDTGDFFDTPVGSTAMVSNLRVTGNPKIPKMVDYIHGDNDLKSSEGLFKLFQEGFQPEYLQNILAGGLIGIDHQRKMVPTRWAITATDDILFKELKKDIIHSPWISDIMQFNMNYVGNSFQVVLFPGPFSFEMLEQWNRGSLWGQGSVSIDYEGIKGRTNYASNITGAYYAARLSVARYLRSIGKQASVIVVRTIGSEYHSPLGVWVIRSSVREALKNRPVKFSSNDEFLKESKLGIENAKDLSWIIRNQKRQKRLADF